MWIVRLALRRPYTFVVLSLLLFIVGPVVMLRTPVDIFPNIDIPVVSVIWNYAGMSPQQLSDRIVLPFERSLTTTVNDIEHSESQTLNGISVTKYSSVRRSISHRRWRRSPRSHRRRFVSILREQRRRW